MYRKIISVLLVFIIVYGLSGCDNATQNLQDTIRVGAMAESGEAIAAQLFCSETGAELIEFETSNDAVTALENGRVDYISLNEYDARSFIDAQRNIAFYKVSGHKLESRAVFSIENNALCEEFNEVIRKLKKNGKIGEIKEASLSGKIYKRPDLTGENGSLVMVCDPIFDNRIYYDESGDLRGTDVDIAMAICEELGYTLEFSVEDFELMFTELEFGNADFIMSSVEFTEQRAKSFIFSDVYSTYEYNIYTVNE